ncbi:hypothetical protein AJ80_08891 [Polytolypa hystricis UAMH7299]|uniref:Riboflavin kinase n=1 Tax=Polytolypa hystricis (strain UAMH7299) TaxID=1447883 RepID=A0A2B7WZM2_POLH7|nr:hypothetical protein AJ80_08891 [Polytolypa hystricis UAMH7299]
MESQNDFSIRRKPAPSYGRDGDSFLAPNPPRPLRPARSATNLTGAHAPQQTGIVDEHGHLDVAFVVDAPPSPRSLSPHPSQEIRRVKSSSALSTTTPQEQKPKDASKWKNALGEAQYFAGGLISHPAESTRHFTIIRHCHALVWYRGPSTSVPITILSDDPLPQNRTMWLQQKGFSGNMGMSLKALVGTTSSWINVTPASRAGPEHLSENEERGMQRDLKRFQKKASGKLKKHVARETHIIRIPAATTDGYFGLVLCAGEEGKKVLCRSPVFRIASTSTDVSVARGASLATMPLEMGVKVASTVGQAVASKYTGIAGAVVGSRAKKLVPNTAVKKAAHAAYHRSGLGDVVSESWETSKAGRYDATVCDSMLDGPLTVVGPDSGPEAPFPVRFEGKVVPGTGISTRELGIPTANLSGVPDQIKMRMGGVFTAWTCILPTKGLEEMAGEWYEAVVTIAPLRNAPPGVVLKKKVTVHIINDFEGLSFLNTTVKILLMGYMHPSAPNMSGKDFVDEHAQDVLTALASLGRANWAPQEAVTQIKTIKSERTFQDVLNKTTNKVHQQVDRIPVHWAGVRSESANMRDQVYGNGGLWIPR